jgi:hypothetical protein
LRRELGVECGEEKQGNLVHLIIRSGNKPHPQVLLRVKSKRRGTWQVSSKDGQANPAPTPTPTFWVFVDLESTPNRFFLMSDTDARRMIYREHQKYLDRHGGRRAGNPDSTHHAVREATLAGLDADWKSALSRYV